MNIKKAAKIAAVAILIVIPFGLTVMGGYYGYKTHKKIQLKKKKHK
tara:strand:- start:14201 stop:14338 length:138 start_codon:yes stop_codon:yes gene_type:complete